MWPGLQKGIQRIISDLPINIYRLKYSKRMRVYVREGKEGDVTEADKEREKDTREGKEELESLLSGWS